LDLAEHYHYPVDGATIALIGDYSPEVVAHQAIPPALKLAMYECGRAIDWRWINSRDILDPARDLATYAAVWAVPGSPYENMEGMLDAIRWARESGRPFLGTCGGFQHAVIEFARNVAGIAGADHAESNPTASELVITPLICPLAGKAGQVRFAPGSRIRGAYWRSEAVETYQCNYSLNTRYAATLEKAGLRFTAWDQENAIRAIELHSHPFFVGTLFQPERAALNQNVPPLVRAFVQAVVRQSWL